MAFDPDKYLNDSGGGFNPDKYLAGGGDAPAPKAPPLPRDESAMPSYGSPTAPETSDTSQAGSDVGARLGAGRMTDKTRSPVQVPTGNQLGKDYGSTAKATGAEIAKSVLGVASWLPRVPSSNSKLVRAAGDQAEKRLNSVEAQAGREYPESIPIAKGISTLASLYPFGKISEGVGRVGPKIAEGVAEYGPKVSNAIGRALPGATRRAEEKLASVGGATDKSTLGQKLSDTLTTRLNKLKDARRKQADINYKAYQTQEAGKAPQVTSEFDTYLTGELGKTRDLEPVEEDLIKEAQAKLKRNPSIEGLEKQLRYLKSVSKQPAVVEGYKAIPTLQAGKMADRLEQILNKSAPLGEKARSEYEAASEPVDLYKEALGRTATDSEKDPALLPSKFFKTKFSIQKLLDLSGGDEAFVNSSAKEYVATELEGKSAADAEKWLKKNKIWLDELPEVRDSTNAYVENLSKTANTQSRAKHIGYGAAIAGGVTGGYASLRHFLGI